MRHVVGLVVAGGLLLAAVPAVATGRGGTRPGWFPAEALAVQQTLRHLAGIERLPGVVGRSPLRSGVAGPRTAAASSGPTSTAASWGPTSTAASSGAASPDYCNQLIPAGRALPGAPLSVLDACDGGGETGPTYWDQWDLIMRRVDTGRAAWEVRVERHGIGYVLVSPGRSPAVPEILFLGLDGLDGPGPLQFTLHAYAPATGRLLWSHVWTQQAQPTV
ncbi:MAG TPA: hypothetical protein VNE21_05105, partial [Mycobacteriales bacterium]|nr:hypothetical protein [Mycobacteriales bacterium]